MNREQLRQTIDNRLALAGAQTEPSLIDSLLTDVGSEPGNLALFEHALAQLWDRRNRRDPLLTTNDYMEIGQFKGSLGRHADEAIATIQSKKKRQLGPWPLERVPFVAKFTSGSFAIKLPVDFDPISVQSSVPRPRFLSQDLEAGNSSLA